MNDILTGPFTTDRCIAIDLPSALKGARITERQRQLKQHYQSAESSATNYVNQLLKQSAQDTFLDELLSRFEPCAQIFGTTANAFIADVDSCTDDWSFLTKLYVDKQLKDYLQKSLDYLALRDLGLDPSHKETRVFTRRYRQKIQQIVRRKSQQDSRQENILNEFFSQQTSSDLLNFRLFWLQRKLNKIQHYTPSSFNKTDGIRKLLKIIAGVVMHEVKKSSVDLDNPKDQARIEQAILLGYCYGITYPYIDDIQDSALLSADEQSLFNQSIEQCLVAGKVPKMPQFQPDNQVFMSFVYQELSAAFLTLKQRLSKTHFNAFLADAYVFFRAQDKDRQNNTLVKLNYADFLVPIVLKSSGSRLIASSLLEQKTHASQRFFYFGIYNQFNDDLKDIKEDLASGNVTPFTAYLNNPNYFQHSPIRIYWSIVYKLIHQVYASEPKVARLMFERSINALKGLREKLTKQEFQEFKSSILSTDNEAFDCFIFNAVEANTKTIWFDKWLSNNLAKSIKEQANKRTSFNQQLSQYQTFINQSLPLDPLEPRLEVLNQNALYSLESGGKRIRAVIALHLNSQHYAKPKENSIPVIQLLEYMHTASLIFDDLPEQDDAKIRRGQPALHLKTNSVYEAELTGLHLMMKAVEVLSQVRSAPQDKVLQAIEYAAKTTQLICEGQRRDLSLSRACSIEALKEMTFLKTGLALEAALVIPAILNGETGEQLAPLKSFAYHLGLAYQIKDDLLDAESSPAMLGKPIGQDNHKPSFVSCMGIAAAERQLLHHYLATKQALSQAQLKDEFFNTLVDMVVFREN